MQLIKKEEKELLVTPELVTKYLKKRIFASTLLKAPRSGMFNGLSYTAYGGDLVPIEVVFYERKEGESEFTGSLGDVLKESCQVALTYIKANAKKFNIEPSFFSKNCIHIHLMEGAVPKDGPSAGIALTTAIISAITGKVIPEYFGATGEITLHGWVEPVGGIKEKLIAAQRKKLKTVFIPKENLKDIDQLPEEIRDKLEILVVENYEEVWAALSARI